MSDIISGFEPVYQPNDSRLLILGSFPSVKSRKVEFYYGNKQNRFWKMLCGYFREDIPTDTAGKISFLYEHKIALWDAVSSCEIEGSSDSKIRNYEIADIGRLIGLCPLRAILLNGTTAYRIFLEKYQNVSVPYFCMPSTSPANTRYSERVWFERLDELYKGEIKDDRL